MEAPETSSASRNMPEFLAGGGEMGHRIRNYDWSTSPLGPVEFWPQSLRTCIRIMLTSRQPIWLGWGKQLIKFYNDPYKAIVGGKHPWALGTPASVVWKDIWRDIEPMLKQVMEEDQGTYAESQLLIMERNGYPEETYYTFSYTPIPGDDGTTAGMICANSDDTDRIISERQLRTLMQLGKNLTDAKTNNTIIAETISTLNENPYDFPFVLLYTISDNKALLANSATTTSATSIPIQIDLDETNELSELLKEALSTKKPQIFTDIKTKMGMMPKGAWEIAPDKAIILPIVQSSSKEAYGCLIVGLNPYRLPDEKYTSFFSLVADQVATSFSDAHLLEQERKRAEALAEIDKAKTTFFSNISHEFRTPLTLLLAPIADVLNNPQTIPENRARAEVAYRNALRMQKLVNTLLDFSRIEAGRMDGRFSRIDICTFTEDLASTFRSAIEKAGMQLQTNTGSIHADVYVDIDMWEKIILNLISNAFKYSKKGTISIDIKQQGNDVHVAIADSGIGIPADQLDKIFNRFHRVENTEGRSQEGTGIGLAMVKELVKLHNGSISVSSEIGKGSVFTVIIPTGKAHLPAEKVTEDNADTYSGAHSVAFVQEATKWLSADANQADTMNNVLLTGEKGDEKDQGSKSKILLADDNADMREYMQHLLSDKFRVITATDGLDAYDKMILHKPELLLTDIMMPRLDGFGLLKKVRSHPELRNIPVIFLSARAGEESKVEGLDAGADDYLVKPFSARELIVRVTNHIRINQVRRETELQFYQLFVKSPAIINVIRGPEHRFEFFHPNNKDIFGNVDFTGMTLRDAMPELEGQGIFEMLDEVYQHGKVITHNERAVTFVRADGATTQRYINFTCQPWYDLKGQIQGVLNFAIDVTETVESRKKIEESESRLEKLVEERTLELRRSNEDLQQFAHVASHDLKEPVRKIKTFSSRLQSECGDSLTESGKMFINKIQGATDRMYVMIEGVLKYSTLNEGQQPIEPLDLNTIIENIEIDFELLVHQKHAVIKKDRLPAIEGASVLIYQLFYNLINNSLKFSRQKVTPVISITSSIEQDGNIEKARIVITDNGIGFDQEYAERIFDTFTRLNSKDKYEGTGLGLALCKKIVERHKGNIYATGERDRGASFIIVIPMKQENKQV